MFKIIMYVISAVICIVLAVAPIVYIKRKFGGSLKRVKDGVAACLIFSSLLNAVLYTVIAVGLSLEEKIDANGFTYAVTNAAVLTLCASVGRIIFVKAVIKKDNGTGDALLFGAGYSSCLVVVSYALSAVANAVISIMLYVNENSQIISVFNSNVMEISNTNLYTVFMGIVQMLLLFVFEGAISVVFYKALLSEYNKKWIFAAILVHLIGNAAIRYDGFSYTVAMVALLVITIIAVGIAYSLFPQKNNKKLGN